MHKLRLLFALLLFCITSKAQIKADSLKFKHKNSISLELGGHGIYYSFNYERIILNKPHFKSSVQCGFMAMPPSTGLIGLAIPITANQIISFGKHHLEFGAGKIFSRDYIYTTYKYQYPYWTIYSSFKIGYRFQRPTGKYTYKAIFTPIMDHSTKSMNGFPFEVYPTGCLSFGYNF